MPRSCIFCGDSSRRLTSEHVFPQWISRLLQKRGYGPFTFDSRRADGLERSFVGQEMPVTIRAVCKTCNSTWLSNLEHRARPVLSSLIQAEELELSAGEQRLVAVWITKTAMLLEHVESLKASQFFTAQERTAFATSPNRTAPARAVIWLGAYQGDDVTVAEFEDWQLTASQTNETTTGIVLTFAIGALAGQMICHRGGEGIREPLVVSLPMRRGDWDRALVPIWPIRDELVRWPPFMFFDDKTLRLLKERWHVPRPSPFELEHRVYNLMKEYTKS